MLDYWTTVLQTAEKSTHWVGAQLLKDFGQVQAQEKGDGSLVTQSDRWADEELRRALSQAFPDHGVLSEEMEHILPDTDWCWVIDPLDGTTNFARGIPIWAISLGLLYRGTPVFGHVHLPTLNYSFHGFWYGDSGLTGPTGAFLNGDPIRSSADPLSHNHFFSLCARSVSVLKNPFPCKIRMLGAATYNLLTVANGSTLGGMEATPKIWDIAAIWAIVRASGAIWHPLEPDPIFPLIPGENYRDRAFPTLVASREDLLPVFKPLVEFLGKSGSAQDSD